MRGELELSAVIMLVSCNVKCTLVYQYKLNNETETLL